CQQGDIEAPNRNCKMPDWPGNTPQAFLLDRVIQRLNTFFLEERSTVHREIDVVLFDRAGERITMLLAQFADFIPGSTYVTFLILLCRPRVCDSEFIRLRDPVEDGALWRIRIVSSPILGP